MNGDPDKPLSGQAAFDHAVQIFADSGHRRNTTAGTPMAAEPWERLLARAIDLAVVVAVFYVLASLYLYPGAVRPPSTEPPAGFPEPELTWVPPPADAGTVVAQSVFAWALFAAYELCLPLVTGETVGKRALRMRLGTAAGKPATARARIVRAMTWTPLAAPATLLFGTTPTALALGAPFVASALMLFRHPLRRTWYHRLAGTVVVVGR